MVPLNVPEAFVTTNVWLPSCTVPLPDIDVTDALPVTPAMEKVPLFTNPTDVAMLPLPERARVPAVMVVLPV